MPRYLPLKRRQVVGIRKYSSPRTLHQLTVIGLYSL
ncbi:hypothetical protein E2C01_087373 [Portunus trituberculatus]|uniref:Uncharacterized protein n=1 Tax=Portunus trituberculatus TaxID=210409 RepID=A0A5B7JD62_PORTR|nr:hypothetical protein [Portunus trituberculatus]